MKNLYLFMGEEKYLLDQELKRWKEKFVAKFGNDSLFVYNSANFKADVVREAVSGAGLFSSQKMVIVYGLPLDADVDNKLSVTQTESFVVKLVDNDFVIPDNVLLIFVSYKPDKRLKFYKSLKNVANIKEFKQLNDRQYIQMIQDMLGKYKIESNVLDYLLLKVGKNLFRLESEIDKIKYYCGMNSIDSITMELIDKIVYGQADVNSFLFFDKFFGKKDELLSVWNDIQNDNTDWNQALGMLYWGLKIYIFMGDLYSLGYTESKVIIQTLKLHPFVVNKNLKNIDKILANYDSIKRFYCNLVDLDYKVKTGKVADFVFWLEVKKMLYCF